MPKNVELKSINIQNDTYINLLYFGCFLYGGFKGQIKSDKDSNILINSVVKSGCD